MSAAGMERRAAGAVDGANRWRPPRWRGNHDLRPAATAEGFAVWPSAVERPFPGGYAPACWEVNGMVDAEWHAHRVEEGPTGYRVRTRASARVRAALGRAFALGGGFALGSAIVMGADFAHDVREAPERLVWRVALVLGGGGLLALALLVARGLPDRVWEVDVRRRVLRLYEPGAGRAAQFEIPLRDVESVDVLEKRFGGTQIAVGLRSGEMFALGAPVSCSGEVTRLRDRLRAAVGCAPAEKGEEP